MSQGSYKISTNTTNKTVELYVKGKAKEADLLEFINEYNKTVNSIQPSQYDLIVDCLEMDLEKQEMIDKLSAVFIMYKETGFKNIIFKVKKANLQKQLSEVARMSGFGEARFHGI
ncbi:MAG TPA: hypothetical protein VNR61_06190 [Niallia sp.]|nr:hypothetical protein [Niallia sp.]